jgi:hypothetical protein
MQMVTELDVGASVKETVDNACEAEAARVV